MKKEEVIAEIVSWEYDYGAHVSEKEAERIYKEVMEDIRNGYEDEEEFEEELEFRVHGVIYPDC